MSWLHSTHKGIVGKTCLTLRIAFRPRLFELADVIENSTHLAEQAKGATVGAAFHVCHPAIREAWGSATNPHHSSSQAANTTGGNRWRQAPEKGGKGFSKGKGKGKGKGKSRSVNAQFQAPGGAPIRRCPALGCTELLTTRKMRVVCDGCYKKSLVNPVPLTQNRTFPDRRPSEGKGGKSRGSPYGKGKSNPPRMHFRDAQRQAHGVDVAAPHPRLALGEKVTGPQGGLQGPHCHELEALGTSHTTPPEIPYADMEMAKPISLQEVNTSLVDIEDLVGRVRGPRGLTMSDEDTDSPTGAMPLNAFAANYVNGDSDGAHSPEPREDSLSPSGIATTPPGSPPTTPTQGVLAGAGLARERATLHTTTRLALGTTPPRKDSKRGWDLTSPNGSMQTQPGDEAAPPYARIQAIQEAPNPNPNPDPDPDPDPDPNTKTRAGTKAGAQGEAGTMVGAQGQCRHSVEDSYCATNPDLRCFEGSYCTADPDPTPSQVNPMPTRKAVPALDQVSGTSDSNGGTGRGNTAGDTDDERSQGEVVYEVPSVVDMLLLLQRSTPPMHLRNTSAHAAAMPPASRCGVGGNATATSPKEVMSAQVHAGNKSAPAPTQPQHANTYLPRDGQHVPQGDSCLPWADTPQGLPTADMVMPQYQPSFTEGSTLNPQEKMYYTLAKQDDRRRDYATKEALLTLSLEDEEEADKVLAEARQHHEVHACSLTSPTASWNDEWIKQEADRLQLGWHHQAQQRQRQVEEQKQIQLDLMLLLQSQEHVDTVQQSNHHWDAALMQELNDSASTKAAPDATAYPYDRSQYPEHWREWNDAHIESREANTAHIPAARRSLDDPLTLSRTQSSLSNLSNVSFSVEELQAILDDFSPVDGAAAEAAQQARDMGLTWIRVPKGCQGIVHTRTAHVT